MLTISRGDTVQLLTPDNPRTNGRTAIVVSVTEWGAHVETDATATRRFRAAWHEMLPVESALGFGGAGAGYTGDVCTRCQGSRMVRNGACLLCLDCGESSGCS